MKGKIGAPPKRETRARLMTKAPTISPNHIEKSSNDGATVVQDLNFKVDPSFHKRFKLEALLRNLSMKELLEAAFKVYLEQHGGSLDSPRRDLL